jgi:dienelactone hydrolase
MRVSTSANLIAETVTVGVRVMRFARPDLRQYLDDDADSATSPLFREVHDTVLSRLPNGWTLIVNLGLIESINAAFYRCLLHIRKCVQARRGRLVLCGLTTWHNEVFDLFRGPDLFTIVSTEAEARRDVARVPNDPEPLCELWRISLLAKKSGRPLAGSPLHINGLPGQSHPSRTRGAMGRGIHPTDHSAHSTPTRTLSMDTDSMTGQRRAWWKRWLSAALRAPELFFRAVRQGFLNTWPIGLAGLALLLTSAARGEPPPQVRGDSPGPPSRSQATPRLSDAQRGLLEVGAIGLLALLIAQLARTKEPRNGQRTWRLSWHAVMAGERRRRSMPEPGHSAGLRRQRTDQNDSSTAADVSYDPLPALCPHRWIGRRRASLAALTLLGAPALAQADKPEDKQLPEVTHFVSGRKEIKVECFSPSRRGKHPVLITLHAVDGIGGEFAKPYHTVAKMYAYQGYVVHLVHYFDRTGATKKDVDGYRKLFLTYFKSKEPRPEDLKRINELSDAWTDVVRDAVKFARAQPNVDDERVVLVGFSLGGCLALTAAAGPELKLAAVVEFFGTLPRELRPGLQKMPPT